MNPPNPAPIEQMNEWSCVLASICWVLEKYGRGVSQEELSFRIGLEFPRWSLRRGLCNWWDIPKIFELQGIKITRMIYTEEVDKSLEFFTDLSNSNQYFSGFVLNTKPTNHCKAIQGLTGDVVFLVSPDLGAPRLEQFRWGDLVRDHEPKILLLGATQ